MEVYFFQKTNGLVNVRETSLNSLVRGGVGRKSVAMISAVSRAFLVHSTNTFFFTAFDLRTSNLKQMQI